MNAVGVEELFREMMTSSKSQEGNEGKKKIESQTIKKCVMRWMKKIYNDRRKGGTNIITIISERVDCFTNQRFIAKVNCLKERKVF